jgi:hypothetical protein
MPTTVEEKQHQLRRAVLAAAALRIAHPSAKLKGRAARIGPALAHEIVGKFSAAAAAAASGANSAAFDAFIAARIPRV